MEIENNKIDIDSIKFTDNILFTKVLENVTITKNILEMILGIKIKNIVIQREKHIDNIGASRGVRFDVYVENSDVIYDIEIQTSNTYDIPKRTRYYHSKIDSNLLYKGDDNFNKLKTSYVIFICLFNPFSSTKTNYPIYKFEKICNIDGQLIKLEDKSYDIFINSNCDVSSIIDITLKSFIEFLNDGYKSLSKSPLTNLIESEIIKIKSDEEWRNSVNIQEYDQKMEAYIKVAIKMIKKKYTDEQILEIVDITKEQLELMRYDVEHGFA